MPAAARNPEARIRTAQLPSDLLRTTSAQLALRRHSGTLTQPRSLTRLSVPSDQTAPDIGNVAGIRNHALAVAIVATAATALALFFTMWHPRARSLTRRPPMLRVPYSVVQFTVSDARRAFASNGVPLVSKSRIPGVVATLGTRDDAFEVDVFVDPAKVNAAGSPDIVGATNGKYVRIPGVCAPGIPDAERWRQNVRFVIRCANPAHSELLASGTRALSKL